MALARSPPCRNCPGRNFPSLTQDITQGQAVTVCLFRGADSEAGGPVSLPALPGVVWPLGCRGWAPCQPFGQTDSCWPLRSAQVAGGPGSVSGNNCFPCGPPASSESQAPRPFCCWLASWAPGLVSRLGVPSSPVEPVLAGSFAGPGAHFCNRIFIPQQGFVPLVMATLGTPGLDGSAVPLSLSPPLFPAWSSSLLFFPGIFLSHALSACQDQLLGC